MLDQSPCIRHRHTAFLLGSIKMRTTHSWRVPPSTGFPGVIGSPSSSLPVVDSSFTQSPLDTTSLPWYVVKLNASYFVSASMSNGLTIVGGGNDADNTYSYVTRDDVPSLLTGSNFSVSVDCTIALQSLSNPRGLAVRASNSPTADFAGFFRTGFDGENKWGVCWRDGGSFGFSFSDVVASNLKITCSGGTMRWLFNNTVIHTRSFSLSGCQPALAVSKFPAGSGSASAVYNNFIASLP